MRCGALLRDSEVSRLDAVKTTLDIPESVLQETVRLTGARTEQEAVVIALSEFNRRRRLQALVEKFGTLEGFMTAEDLRQTRQDP